MKALSIKQPWAWLIVNGYKDIENRSWQTKHRGPLAIHAGKSFDVQGFMRVRHKFPDIPMPETADDFERGGIVGIANIIDVTRTSMSPWFEGKFGFVLEDAKPLEFIELKGQLQVFEVVL